MKLTKPNRTSTHINIDAGLDKLYRLRGQLIPTSPEDVAAAEASIDTSAIELPDLLRTAPVLPVSEPLSLPGRQEYWTNSSVRQLNATNPVEAIVRKARQVVLSAIEKGWSGPPYDPSGLAELLNISLIPTEDVIDARTKSERGRFRIEFNPMRPAARLRFSIAHEIGHTFFPDCADSIRNRATHEQMAGDEWQLEMLCNIAASEILMPIGSLPNPQDFRPTVEAVLDFRRRFQVSSEAVLLRLVQLSASSCFVLAAHREPGTNRYRVDYGIKSPAFSGRVPVQPGSLLPRSARAAECTAIGFTAKGSESWIADEAWPTEYLGIAPYPGQVFPRVLGIVRPSVTAEPRPIIRYVRGDASEPRGKGLRVLLQVVNDKAITWGAGFSRALRMKWPAAQREFSNWALSNRREFKLGSVHFARIADDLILASLVAQKGYGETTAPRIRYAALREALASVATLAERQSASVHMPRIGTGLAGGAWAIVEEIVLETLGQSGSEITVYDLPNQKPKARPQLSLFDVPADLDQFL